MIKLIRESELEFYFDDNCDYHLEKSPTLEKIKGVKRCEFVRLLDNQICFIEAKTSSPNPKNNESLNDYLKGIKSKFDDSLKSFHAIILRHNQDTNEVSPKIIENVLNKISYSLFLIVKTDYPENLDVLMNALKSELKTICRLWKIEDKDVKVLDETRARKRKLIK